MSSAIEGQREIKFRAWSKSAKKMGYIDQIWNDDWYSHPKNTKPGIAWQNCNRVMGSGRDFQLMRFTGLKDKNGKEIYEGDILKGHFVYANDDGSPSEEKEESIKTVVWADKSFNGWPGFQVGYINFGEFPVEVIGNIYETPELTEEKKS